MRAGPGQNGPLPSGPREVRPRTGPNRFHRLRKSFDLYYDLNLGSQVYPTENVQHRQYPTSGGLRFGCTKNLGHLYGIHRLLHYLLKVSSSSRTQKTHPGPRKILTPCPSDLSMGPPLHFHLTSRLTTQALGSLRPSGVLDPLHSHLRRSRNPTSLLHDWESKTGSLFLKTEDRRS